MKEEQWLKKIKERLDDYSEEIPSDGWQRLEKALGEVGATPFRQEEKRAKVIPLRRWLAVAASVTLVVAGSLSLWLLNGPADERMRLAQTPVELTEEPVIEEPVPLPRAEEEDTRLAVAVPLSRPAIVRMDEKEEEPQTDAPRTENNRTVAPDTSRTDEAERPKRKTSLEADIPMTYESKRTRKGWSFGMAVGGRGMASDGAGGASFVMSNDMTGSLSSSNINLSAMADGVIAIPNGQALAFKAGKPYLMARERVLTSADHHQPVSAGFSVRKELGKGFSVETGLTYTFLASDLHYEGDSEAVSQKLHYLGVPLRANWNFVDTRLFTLYLSAGGAVEKCVYGKQDGEALSQRPWQFSVLGAVGAQYNLSRRVGVYVEPGVSYYFDDGSSLATLRKDHPCGFTLQAGLRLTY